ncbi:MAG: bifunctional histidinol-phosphatase/imidazoleglycerol-phosphate dehydratase HisB [Bacteroidales bacterium]|nr:MAG: bifunctional histidinol-phosphatase/imidazoleglycerol-phosphate dehydratase HisB [Bacteroidales bacterium]
MRKVLFIDRDGTLIVEPPDEQVDSLEKLEFIPKVFRNLFLISQNLEYELVIVTNQDGLGTDSFPEDTFRLVHNKMIKAFENEGIVFDDVLIDKTFPHDNAGTRKPKTGLLKKYTGGKYDLKNSYVIGDRLTDIEMAKNLGSKGILFSDKITKDEIKKSGLEKYCSLITGDWDKIYDTVALGQRSVKVRRKTGETDILAEINLDGSGRSDIETGLGFFDHVLDQIPKHANIDLKLTIKGDLEVDEHHTIEDTAIALGEAVNKSLGDKRGIERYGFVLPMDDSLAQVTLDFAGRSWLVWEVEFLREKIGGMPTEMFYHFFKSFSDAAKCNLNIKAEGKNEHHKIEAIFKAFAKAIKAAVKRDAFSKEIPTTKGLL